jgi:hypothetical protein
VRLFRVGTAKVDNSAAGDCAQPTPKRSLLAVLFEVGQRDRDLRHDRLHDVGGVERIQPGIAAPLENKPRIAFEQFLPGLVIHSLGGIEQVRRRRIRCRIRVAFITTNARRHSPPAGVVDIYHISAGPGSFWVNENFLAQSANGAVPVSYTMDFSTPLESISFSRIATPFNLTTEPVWSATAYAGNVAVGTVGESLDSWGNSPAKSFTLTGDGITSLTISANGFGFTGIGSVPLNDFVLTTVPEPSTLVLWSLMAGLFGVVWVRKQMQQPALGA